MIQEDHFEEEEEESPDIISEDAKEVDSSEDAEEDDSVTDEWIGEEDWGEEEDDEEVLEEVLPNYIDNGDGTISDPRNKLMWAKSDSYAEFGYGITWYEAQDFCETVNEKKLAGYDDWRLCGFDEAKTLFSFSKSNRDKDGAEIHVDPMFESGGGHNTWTYDEKPDYHQYAQKFSYITGNDTWEHKDNEYSHVRLVRDERKEEWEPEWREGSKKFEG